MKKFCQVCEKMRKRIIYKEAKLCPVCGIAYVDNSIITVKFIREAREEVNLLTLSLTR